MKNLLLLLLAVYFYSNPVAAAAAKSKLQLDLRFGECPGGDPNRNPYALRPSAWIFMITDKETDIIENVVVAPYEKHSERYTWTMKPEILKTFARRGPTKEFQVAVFVQTLGDDKMTGIDNQIFYGYVPMFWVKEPNLAGVPADKQLRHEPFRYGEVVFTLKHANGKEEKIFEAKEKGCNHDNYEAWIANHGIYRLEKNQKGEHFFSNLYYWPRTGMMFT